MNFFTKHHFSLLALALSLVITGCSSDGTDILETPEFPETPEMATIRITEGGSTEDNFDAVAMGEAGSTTSGRVVFTTTDSKQRRLYVTQTLPGEPEMPFTAVGLTNKGLKSDGSIDLDGDVKKELDFTFDLSVPSAMEDGSIIYRFWTTTGRGDFRDTEKRKLLGVGTITVSVGTGENPETAIKEISGKKLMAPLGSGDSATFVSLFDLTKDYKIIDGAEQSAFWDLGYFYGATSNASIASTSNYPSNIVDILKIANETKPDNEAMVEAIDLKKVYFKLNTTVNFEAVSVKGDLDALTVSSSDPERVTMLEVGDVIEFIDDNGKKGLIKVDNITGTDGTTGSMTISIKVQS